MTKGTKLSEFKKGEIITLKRVGKALGNRYLQLLEKSK